MYSSGYNRRMMYGASQSSNSLRQRIQSLEESGLSASDILDAIKRSDDLQPSDTSFWGSNLWFYGAVLGVGCATYILSRILVPDVNTLLYIMMISITLIG